MRSAGVLVKEDFHLVGLQLCIRHKVSLLLQEAAQQLYVILHVFSQAKESCKVLLLAGFQSACQQCCLICYWPYKFSCELKSLIYSMLVSSNKKSSRPRKG